MSHWRKNSRSYFSVVKFFFLSAYLFLFSFFFSQFFFFFFFRSLSFLFLFLYLFLISLSFSFFSFFYFFIFFSTQKKYTLTTLVTFPLFYMRSLAIFPNLSLQSNRMLLILINCFLNEVKKSCLLSFAITKNWSLAKVLELRCVKFISKSSFFLI